MGPDDRLQLGLERGIRGGLRSAGSRREELAHDVILPAGGRGGAARVPRGGGPAPRAPPPPPPRPHLAGPRGERPRSLEPLARLSPLRQDIDACEEPVRMEVVEIA